MNDLAGKRAVVTGAGSGIGRALAIALNARGCHLELADIQLDALEQTRQLLTKPEPECQLQQLDVSDQRAMEAWAASVAERHEAVDILINNAGVTIGGTAEENSLEDVRWLMGINFWGVVYGCKFFLPLLHRSPAARLVNISSVFGLIGVPTQSAYNASKFAVRGYTEALRQELADSQISVCCVHPGGVKTNIARAARSGRPDGRKPPFSDQFEDITRTTPDQAAQVILRAITKWKPRLVIGLDGKFIAFVARMFPASYPQIFKFLLGVTASKMLTID
ncbi:MAG: SDR family NAD(P)-dependent oxidoreductase [Pseudomonadota bacterium]